jgi:hypothetical protein
MSNRKMANGPQKIGRQIGVLKFGRWEKWLKKLESRINI